MPSWLPSRHEDSKYLIIWEFRVKAGQESRFEQAYGPDGVWVQLFGNDNEYGGTDLLADSNQAGRYVTMDFWKSKEAYDSFRERNRGEYERIDKDCAEMTEAESAIGTFERLG